VVFGAGRAALALVLVIAGFGSSPSVRAEPFDVDPQVERIVAAVSQDRLVAILKKLESFGTRNTLSSVDSATLGIGAARQWIFDEMKGYSPKLQVSFDTYQVAKQGRITRDVELRNVMAVLPGTSARRVYVSGHYDTIAAARGSALTPARDGSTGEILFADPDSPAPGVDDDGSGTALTMELARIFSQSGIEFDATLVFMCHVAEEQGLFGAFLHAQKAVADKVRIDAVLNNDIVGGDRAGNGIVDGATIRVYSEGPEDSPSRELARFVQRWAARYVPSHRVRLLARPDRFSRGGDHTAYNQLGFPAVGFRESRENFARQHGPQDTFDGVSPPYLAQNARVNAAAAATLALAPPAPVVVSVRREPSGYDAALKWNAAPGATGYRLFWREAWGPDWQNERLLGNVTEVVLPNVQIDDYVFGVASVDATGHESVVAPYLSPARARITVKTIP
jgi:Peptidase family M28